MSAYSPLGSLWNRWDLHFHTPSSFDYEDKSISNQKIVDSLVQVGLRVITITDHHTMDVCRIQELQTLGAGKLTVLPGIELRDEHGSEPIHYICIFPEDRDLDHVWTRLYSSQSARSGRFPAQRVPGVAPGLTGLCLGPSLTSSVPQLMLVHRGEMGYRHEIGPASGRRRKAKSYP